MYLPILTYHRLLSQEPTKTADPKRISVSQQQFRDHLRWLKRLGYRTLRLDEYVKGFHEGRRFPKKSFAITFDDGYEDVLRLALPILEEHGFTATVFAVPGETRNQWDDGETRLMTSEELRRFEKAGMLVGAHTSHHVHLTRTAPEAARREIRESKAMLEDILKHPVSLFAYPYGETNKEVEALIYEAGFEAAFATDHAPQDHSENLYRLRRTVVFPKNTIGQILIKVQPWYPAYQDWKR